MSRIPRWLQALPDVALFAAVAVLALIPPRARRLTAGVIITGAGVIITAVLLILAWRYTRLTGGLT